jgi:alkanesulfonate monooxygenase SsuD/methylene tetrahydromethanopterin reductase-like flavin-dependent oxidoreductase (luciferase family)
VLVEFSVIFEAQLANPTRVREHHVLHQCVEQAVLAEQAGFDRVWAVEHHGLTRYAHMSAPEIFLSFVAARTRRIRIGHGVVCMPFGYNHPVRVGERAAMLDALSGGRLDLGAGRGATQHEMSLMGVKADDTYPQMEEALRMIAKFWVQEEFEWHGSLDITPHAIIPRPVQEPHPPLFLACTKRDTIKLAAEWGVGALVMAFAGPSEVTALRAIYDATIEQRSGKELVSSVVNDHLAALCPTIVLDDKQAAIQIGARGQRFFAEAVGHWYAGGPLPSDADNDGDQVVAIERAKERYMAYLHEAKIPAGPHSAVTYKVEQAYGDAACAIAHVEALRDAGADEILCLIQMGTVPHEACMETIRQWGRHVIPHFRKDRS